MTLFKSFAASTPADESDSVMRIERGDKVWRNKKGVLHRTDGPAAENTDGSKEWRLNGQYHRIDGPAIEWADGSKEWWINGKRLTENKFKSHLEKLATKKKVLAEAAHQERLARINQLASRVTRNRGARP